MPLHFLEGLKVLVVMAAEQTPTATPAEATCQDSSRGLVI